MTQGLNGCDPDDLRRFARDLQGAQLQLTAVKNELGTRISSNLRWEGADAFVFRHAWRSSYEPVMSRAASMLAETSAHLEAEAAEQDAASGA